MTKITIVWVMIKIELLIVGLMTKITIVWVMIKIE